MWHKVKFLGGGTSVHECTDSRKTKNCLVSLAFHSWEVSQTVNLTFGLLDDVQYKDGGSRSPESTSEYVTRIEIRGWSHK